MASLTEISIIARKGVRYGIYAIILIVILRYTILAGVSVFKKLFPPAPPKPTVTFGKLPEILFPPRSTPGNLSFKLETADGKLPVFPNQIEVYSMPKPESSISALDSAKEIAKGLGSNPDGKVIVENVPNVYLFKKNNFPATLTMNIVTRIFSISYDVASDPSVIQGFPPTEEIAASMVKSYLSSAGLMTKDLASGRIVHQFLRVEGGKFVNADSLSDASLIKTNIFRKGFSQADKIPSVTPEVDEANVWIITSGGRGRQVVAAEYHYYPIDPDKKSTYPIKTSQDAWTELEKGNAFVAKLGENQEGVITIRKVYLAYYDAGLYIPYYQPVVVFEGDGGFFAYVPAVNDSYYGEEQED